MISEKEPDLQGRTELFNLEGSIFKWANEGRPMIDNRDRPTKHAHPYNSVWGKLLNKSLRKSEADP